MDRLTMRNTDGTIGVGHPLRYYNHEDIVQALNRLADYEDMEEQGRLLILPCKVGDSFFRIERFCDEHGDLEEATRHWGSDCEYCCKPCNGELRITEYSFANIRHIIDLESTIGETVFLTREEAEAALKGGKQDGAD